MGYDTHFNGEFKFDRELSHQHSRELMKIHDTRHGNATTKDQDFPGMYCQWVPNETYTGLVWDGEDKFYEYIPWLKWLIDNVFEPNGYKLNGKVYWVGEQPTDIGTIEVKDNEIWVTKGQIIYDTAKTVKI